MKYKVRHSFKKFSTIGRSIYEDDECLYKDTVTTILDVCMDSMVYFVYISDYSVPLKVMQDVAHTLPPLKTVMKSMFRIVWNIQGT